MKTGRCGCRSKIGPSLLASDLSELNIESKRVLDAGADYLHLDIMDGHFVPNITWGPPVVNSLRKHHPKVFFDCHMMVSKPEQWVDDLAKGAEAFDAKDLTQFTFHYESTSDPKALIAQIRKAGLRVGVAIKPETASEKIKDLVQLVDMVLVMTVEPGFGGQGFMAGMLPKVTYFKKLTVSLGLPNFDIEVDGGVSAENAKEIGRAGANMLVAGTSVFKSAQPSDMIAKIRSLNHESLSQTEFL